MVGQPLLRDIRPGWFRLRERPPQKKNAVYLDTGAEWTTYTGEFKTGEGGTHVFTISLWHNTRYGKMFYSIGDHILIDNISIQEK